MTGSDGLVESPAITLDAGVVALADTVRDVLVASGDDPLADLIRNLRRVISGRRHLHRG